MTNTHRIFINGGTGYIGQRLIPALHARGHDVIALTRQESQQKLPWSCTPVIGNALDGESYRRFTEGADTFIQLVGVSHPSPAKAAEFIKIDRAAGLEAIRIVRETGIQHLIYLSVAQPAPVMQAYIAVRAECERAIAETALNATILRPWYILGPGHRWPCFLVPFFKLAEQIPSLRPGALRLGFVTLEEMVNALLHAVEDVPTGIRVLEVSEIRRVGRTDPAPRATAHTA